MHEIENSIKKIIQDGSKAAQAVKDDYEITDMKGGGSLWTIPTHQIEQQ